MIELGKAHSTQANFTLAGIELDEATALTSLTPDAFDDIPIDVFSIRSNFNPADPDMYRIGTGGAALLKVGGLPQDSLSCELASKPRPGKWYARVRFLTYQPELGGYYCVAAISSGPVTPDNQLAWTASLELGVWHDVHIEHVSGDTYKFSISNKLIYTGTAKHLTFYMHTAPSVMEFDVGQLDTKLPAGYQWY